MYLSIFKCDDIEKLKYLFFKWKKYTQMNGEHEAKQENRHDRNLC